jgi:hypothetical protein
MGSEVYANGMEVSGKASDHNVIASMPDVCLSPPSPPAGPVPIPYPNFAQASDTTDGSKTVTAGGKEINLKGQSKYKKSTGDEAATRSFGANVMSHTITGSVKHKAGSFDVKVEGAAVVRHMDLTTGNHNNPGGGCSVPDAKKPAPPGPPPDCKKLQAENDKERESLKKASKAGGKAHRTVRRAARGNTTISHATFSGSPGEILMAASKGVIQKYDNRFKKGLKIRRNKKDKTVSSKACGGDKYKYKKVPRPRTSHTESRIIEDIFSKTPPPTGGTLVFAINWPGGEAAGKSSTAPCDHCKELICAVAKPNGCLEILICDDNNKPQKPKCPKE